MLFHAVSPGLLQDKVLSQAAQGFRSNLHPLRSPSGRNYIRSQFSISDWLLISLSLQAVIVHFSPYPGVFTLGPIFALVLYKVVRTFLITCGLTENLHMRGVHIGRTTAIYPEADGSFDRKNGSSFGGDGVCIMLLSTKCNHPLGMMYPAYKTITELGRNMFVELEKNSVEFGFLGHSIYNSTEDITKPVSLSILYFKSLDHVYKFSHSKVHQVGFKWFTEMGTGVNHVTIGHEVYDVPKGKWENIYVNAKPYGFAATCHAVKAEGTEIKWVCPIVDAKKMGGRYRLKSVES